MGHLAGKDLYRRVGARIDGLTARAPWDETLHRIVRALFSEPEADVFVRMPTTFSSLDRVARVTGIEGVKLRCLLEGMADKGLVLDLLVAGEVRYMPSPLFIGLFEFTMMRTGDGVDSASFGRLFHDYLESGAVYAANTAGGARTFVIRALPHETSLGDHVEILDYEKASAIVAGAERFSLGICSCRHEKMHAGARECDGPLEMCTSFGYAADYLVRHGLAREISRAEMQDHLERSRERGLVLSADNVQRNVTFICHCCACCCNILRGVSRFGYANAIVTSSFIARPEVSSCKGCGACAKACPVGVITMAGDDDERPAAKRPQVDAAVCIGCGVCGVACPTGAMRLARRAQRVIHPETTFERVILQCLERGTLQNQIFDDPESLTQEAMRGILGAFLALAPVKRALMSDLLRSRFLAAMKVGVALQGNAELTAL